MDDAVAMGRQVLTVNMSPLTCSWHHGIEKGEVRTLGQVNHGRLSAMLFLEAAAGSTGSHG